MPQLISFAPPFYLCVFVLALCCFVIMVNPHAIHRYMQPRLVVPLGGMLPFAAVFVELSFVLTSVWLDRPFGHWMAGAFVLLVLTITSAEIGVITCYFHLCCEVIIPNPAHTYTSTLTLHTLLCYRNKEIGVITFHLCFDKTHPKRHSCSLVSSSLLFTLS